jgi:hypothetical protein
MNRPRTITRRLVLLCALLMCLMALTTGFGFNGPRPDRNYLPCCSACDSDNPPAACRFGCSPSCIHHR